MADGGVIAGAVVVVTRAAHQAEALVDALEAHGAQVHRLPLLEIVDDAEGLVALRRALADTENPPDGILVTSPNGARRVAAAWAAGDVGGPPVFVVGPGTREAFEQAGGPRVAGVAADHVAEGLLELMGAGSGRLVVAQGDLARPILVEGLRTAGWQVTPITVYRTQARRPPAVEVERARGADVVTLASGSAASAWAEVCAPRFSPPVVAMGPVTAEVARHRGLPLVEVAQPPTLEGLVEATVRALDRRRRSGSGSGS